MPVTLQLLLPSAAAVLVGTAALALWKRQQHKKQAPNLDFKGQLPDQPAVPDSALAFLQEYTGVNDLGQLRQGVLAVCAKVKAQQHVYKCISTLSFLSPKVQRHPVYAKLLAANEAGQAKPADGAGSAAAPAVRVVDIGCCFGQDVRRLLVDGIQPESILAVDIHDGYWQAGKELFLDNSTPTSKLGAVPTLFADLATPPGSSIDAQLASAGYTGTFGFAYSLAVLHVLSKDQVTALLQRVRTLLIPGSGRLFGWTLGSAEPREWSQTVDNSARRFLHSAESLTRLFEELGYVDVVVKVVTTGDEEQASQKAGAETATILQWVRDTGLLRLGFAVRSGPA